MRQTLWESTRCDVHLALKCRNEGFQTVGSLISSSPWWPRMLHSPTEAFVMPRAARIYIYFKAESHLLETHSAINRRGEIVEAHGILNVIETPISEQKWFSRGLNCSHVRPILLSAVHVCRHKLSLFPLLCYLKSLLGAEGMLNTW